MAEFVHIFQAGRMNKDLDERLIPNGEYRDALNLDLANSERSNVGVLQNVKGNIELRGKQDGVIWQANYIEDLENPVCIGSIADETNEKIYWFISSEVSSTHPNGVSAIAEYDQTTEFISPILVDTQGILKFTKDYLITGINILDKFLFWTDDQTEPKKININKFKTGSVNFSNHTVIPKWMPQQDAYNSSLAGRPDFVLADITSAKLSPLDAPTFTALESKFGNNVPGTGITPVFTSFDSPGLENLTYVPDTSSLDNTYFSFPTYGEYLDKRESGAYLGGSFDDPANNPDYDSTYGWTGNVTFTVSQFVGDVWAIDSSVIMTGEYENDFGENQTYEVQMQIKQINGTTIVGQIQGISSNIQKAVNGEGEALAMTWECVLREDESMFEYIFPRFAYRWKYIDNEYSAFSPFTSVAFLGGEFEYVSSDAHNIGMVNRIKKLTINDLEWSNHEISHIDILYKESNSTAVYVVDTLDKEKYSNTTLPDSYEIKTELISKLVESNQILRPWDNVPRAAKAQEIIGNRLVYGNYLQNYNTVDVINPFNDTVSTTVDLSLSVNSTSHEPIYEIKKPASSIKSIRTYQIGVVYKDQMGRETPVFSSQDASVQLDISESDKVNNLQVTPKNIPPYWATHYKFFVKEISNEYYNLAMDRFYHAEDGNIWLSFPSSERNKVDEETYLILKKQHDNDVAVDDLVRYKILSISSEAPKFISTFDVFKTGSEVELINNIEPGRLTLTFNGPTNEKKPLFHAGFTGIAKIKIETGGTTSDFYSVEKMKTSGTENDVYNVVLTEPLGPEVPDVAAGQTITINIFEPETKNLPEFEGRFFAKINRNFAFDTNIIESFAALAPKYATRDEVDFKAKFGWGTGGDTGLGFFYGDAGRQGSKNGCSSRPHTDSIFGWSSMPYAGAAPAFGAGVASLATWQGEGYAPPTQGRRVFGFVYNGIGENVFINFMVGFSGSRDEQRPITGGLLSPGAKIRFQSQTGDQSEVYEIKRTNSLLRPRGGRYRGGNGQCDNWMNEWANWKVVFLIELTKPISDSWMPTWNQQSVLDATLPALQVVEPITTDGNKLLSSNNPAIFETEPKEAVDLNLYYEASNAIDISNYNNVDQQLDWSNCFSYGNGVESNRIRDDYNAPFIDKGPKVSATLDAPYAAERRGSGFIFSQIYNSTSGINRLNQFIQAEPITKDLNPVHGTIQKLHARDTDLITLCEDKCFRVLANKDALFNADGNVNLTGNNAVLGQAIPYAGDYGISKNPESFASFAFRSYFTDKNRGTVIRLSRDGITDIGSKGMSDFYADNLRTSKQLIGLYDDDKGLYHLALDTLSQQWQNTFSTSQDYQLNPECNVNTDNPVLETTVSFKEEVDGWTSRKSFIPESGISLNNIFYTFKEGRIYEHSLNATANNFYRTQYDSSFNVIVNEMPQVVKGFSAINYTGTRSRLLEYQKDNKFYSIAEVNANQIIPTAVQQKRAGWYVNFVKTDLEGGEVKEFQKKEGKYFNFIKGLEVFNDCETTFDGIGNPDVEEHTPNDYNLTFTIDLNCSDPGNTVIFDSVIFWYLWDRRKPQNNCVDPLNIKTISTAQDTKCAIEDFYTCDVSSDYVNILPMVSQVLSYDVSEGLNVGTQMYNLNTQDPASAQTLLYTNEQNVDHGSLDPDNPTAVPDSYDIVIIGSDGKIDSITQYNTLDECSIEPDAIGVMAFSTNFGDTDPSPIAPGFWSINHTFDTGPDPTSSRLDNLVCLYKVRNEQVDAVQAANHQIGNQGGQELNFGIYQSENPGGGTDVVVGTRLYTNNNPANQWLPYMHGAYQSPATSLAIHNASTNTALPANFYDLQPPASGSVSDDIKIVEIDANGYVVSITQWNTLSDCPTPATPDLQANIFYQYESESRPNQTPPNWVITPYSFDSSTTNEEIVCAHRKAMRHFFNNSLPLCSPSAPSCKEMRRGGQVFYFNGPSQGGTASVQVGTQLYRFDTQSGQYVTVNDHEGIINTDDPSSGLSYPPFDENFWDDTSTIDSKYKILRTNSNGIITHLDQINSIPNPPCV